MSRLPVALSELGASRVRLSLRLLILASKSDPGLMVDTDWMQSATSLQIVLAKHGQGRGAPALCAELKEIEEAIV